MVKNAVRPVFLYRREEGGKRRREQEEEGETEEQKGEGEEEENKEEKGNYVGYSCKGFKWSADSHAPCFFENTKELKLSKKNTILQIHNMRGPLTQMLPFG